ncbi:MAG: hypothetical protein NTNFB02_01480 [Nitrospira sp.]
MTAETFMELSARATVLIAKQEQLLTPIRERRVRLLTVLEEGKLIGMEGAPPASTHGKFRARHELELWWRCRAIRCHCRLNLFRGGQGKLAEVVSQDE